MSDVETISGWNSITETCVVEDRKGWTTRYDNKKTKRKRKRSKKPSKMKTSQIE